MKGEFEGELAPAMRTAARALARRAENTPDVLQARVLLATHLSAACIEAQDDDAREESLDLARTLLDTPVGTATPERVMWETRAYGIQSCADNMAKAGYITDAVELYDALADQLPGSKIADTCRESLSKLFHHKPLPLTNAAE